METIMLQSLTIVLFGLLYLGPDQVHSEPRAPSGGPGFFGQSAVAAIEAMGYTAESYNIRSNQAGYVIGVNRMINPLANPDDVKRVVLFNHGIIQDSLMFLGFAGYARPERPTADSYSKDIYSNATDGLDAITQEPTKETYKKLCLPCVFANNNYDVWIMDFRGVSKASEQFDEEDFEQRGNGTKKDYWDFSIDEPIFFDLPAIIDFIRGKSDQPKISYVGYSLGTLEMFALLSAKPEYADKIEAYAAVGPTYYLSHLRGLFPLLTLTDPLLRPANSGSLINFDVSAKVNRLLWSFCAPPQIRLNVCMAAYQNFIVGPDTNKLNIFTEAYFSHFLETYSIKVFVHAAQIIKFGGFNTFDHANPKDNLREYNSLTPIPIKPENITHKKIIYVRSVVGDYLSTIEDQQQFLNELTVPLFEDIITQPGYNHISFFMSKTSFTQVFGPIIRAVNKAYVTDL